MDEASPQLQETLRQSVRSSLLLNRPILTHLNADTSWLLQLPYPPKAKRPRGRSRFNILIDPWFRGPQSDIASWFSSQWHAIDSSVQSIEELNGLLFEIEAIYQQDTGLRIESNDGDFIDAVAISHEFTDHCNKATLLELDRNTPIFAPKIAAALIRSWNHFINVFETVNFSAEQNDWRDSSMASLPDWIGITRMAPEDDSLYYHSAVMVTFDLHGAKKHQRKSKSPTEAVIYTPHGVRPETVRHFPEAEPPLKALVLVHGLHDIKLTSKQLNLGAHNGLQVERLCSPKYWVSTHDEVKVARGIIAPFLHRKVFTLQDALEHEKRERGHEHIKEVICVDMASGESLVLT